MHIMSSDWLILCLSNSIQYSIFWYRYWNQYGINMHVVEREERFPFQFRSLANLQPRGRQTGRPTTCEQLFSELFHLLQQEEETRTHTHTHTERGCCGRSKTGLRWRPSAAASTSAHDKVANRVSGKIVWSVNDKQTSVQQVVYSRLWTLTVLVEFSLPSGFSATHV